MSLKSFRKFTLLLAGALFICAPAAKAWDATGHMIVAQIAYEKCKPTVRDKVNALVSKLDNRFNATHPYNFVTAAAWMDDIKSDKTVNVWSSWHYMDIPYSQAGSPAIMPAPPNVMWAIQQNMQTLRDPKSTEDQQRMAVTMLIHFMGDIHQPLHCTDWGDRGGNDYIIQGVAFSDPWPRERINLHSLWDRAFRFGMTPDRKVVELFPGVGKPEDRPTSPDAGVVKEQAEKIMATYPAENQYQLAGHTDIADWARESYLLACVAVYPPGPHPAKNQAVNLSPEYFDRLHAIANQRLAMAGYRLADLLNQAFGSK